MHRVPVASYPAAYLHVEQVPNSNTCVYIAVEVS